MSDLRSGVAVLLGAALLASAPAAARAQQAAPVQRSSEETARSIAARWKTLLDLSGEQTTQFENLALSIEKKTAAAKTAAAGDSARLEATMTGIYKERQEGVAKILTPDQLKKYDELMARARRKAAQKGASGAPARPPA